MRNVMRIFKRRSGWILLAAVAGFSLFTVSPASAGFRIGIDIRDEHRPRQREYEERVWCPPVYRTECERVWVQPVYRCEVENVWVPERCEERWVVRHNGWREYRECVRVVVEPGHWERRDRQVLVTRGHYEERSRQVMVSPGHWETRRVRHADRSDRDHGHTHGQLSIEVGRRW